MVGGNSKITNTDTATAESFAVLTRDVPLIEVFTIAGQANGTAKRGLKTLSTVHPNYRSNDQSVQLFADSQRGMIEVRKGNTTNVVLDYGSGICDSKATLSVNGTVHEITLY